MMYASIDSLNGDEIYFWNGCGIVGYAFLPYAMSSDDCCAVNVIFCVHGNEYGSVVLAAK